MAADDAGRLAVHEAGGVPLLIKLMDDGSPNMVRLLTVINRLQCLVRRHLAVRHRHCRQIDTAMVLVRCS